MVLKIPNGEFTQFWAPESELFLSRSLQRPNVPQVSTKDKVKAKLAAAKSKIFGS